MAATKSSKINSKNAKTATRDSDSNSARTSPSVSKFSQVLNQAKESLKLLEALEKDALARAKNLVKIPSAIDRKRKTNKKILTSLKRIGVASQADLDSLLLRVE